MNRTLSSIGQNTCTKREVYIRRCSRLGKDPACWQIEKASIVDRAMLSTIIYPILWRAIFGGRVFVSEFGEMLDLLLAAFLAFPCFSMTSPAFLSSHCFSVVAPAFLIFSAFVCLLRFSLFLCECFCLLFPLPLRLVCSSWLFSFTVPLVFVEAY